MVITVTIGLGGTARKTGIAEEGDLLAVCEWENERERESINISIIDGLAATY